MKTLTAVLAALFALGADELAKATDKDRAEVRKALGLRDDSTVKDLEGRLALAEERVELLAKENRDKTAELAEIKRGQIDGRRDAVIEAALKDGKITPKNRERWEQMFAKDPEGTEALLSAQEPVVDMESHGTGEVPSEISDEDEASAKLAGLSVEQYLALTRNKEE